VLLISQPVILTDACKNSKNKRTANYNGFTVLQESHISKVKMKITFYVNAYFHFSGQDPSIIECQSYFSEAYIQKSDVSIVLGTIL
jgi:hypothetical protein